MRGEQKPESPEERTQRLLWEVQTKKEAAAAEEAAIDRMIRRNIEQFGP